ncbi:MAG: NAD(P)H-hydrate dehydratase [Acidobacteria bacterium]|nr:NAD(P)H-hydrate dehydratase [Acidobacteriota bacterium]
MKILTAAQMRAVDRRCIESMGIAGFTLMENASLQVYAELWKRWPDLELKRVTIVCGKGNNGGDGLATARHICSRGGQVRVILLARTGDLKGDALTNLDAARAAGVQISEATDEASWHAAWSEAPPEIVVDALFGTGLAAPATGIAARAIEEINSSGAWVLAIDVPSGLSSDTGEVLQPSVRANVTVALQCLKLCHAVPPACDRCGDVALVPIGIPADALEDPTHRIEMLDPGVASCLPTRRRDSHKGHYGHALVVAGSMGKTGAAVMTGMAAYRAGAGLVTVATPWSCLPIVASGAAEIMTEALPETVDGTIDRKAAERVRDLAGGRDVLLIGPGVTTNASTVAAVREIIRTRTLPVVVDADAISCFANDYQLLKAAPEAPPVLITPHPGELSRLLGKSIGEILRDRVGIASQVACELGLYVVLKGYRSIIATPSGDVFINPTGNPGMATGGSGDVLTGIAGGLLAQGVPLPQAANFAVYIHGLAGDLAARETGEVSLVATDLLRFLPAAFRTAAAAVPSPS